MADNPKNIWIELKARLENNPVLSRYAPVYELYKELIPDQEGQFIVMRYDRSDERYEDFPNRKIATLHIYFDLNTPIKGRTKIMTGDDQYKGVFDFITDVENALMQNQAGSAADLGINSLGFKPLITQSDAGIKKDTVYCVTLELTIEGLIFNEGVR